VAQTAGLSPFLDVKSFSLSPASPAASPKSATSTTSPFLSVYELDELADYTDPSTREGQTYAAEMHDDELDESLFEVISEASDLCDHGGVSGNPREAARLLDQHFQPLRRELDRVLDKGAERFAQSPVASTDPEEVASFFEAYSPSQPMQPAFENLFGGLLRSIKKVAGKAIDFAKQGIGKLASVTLGPLLSKLKEIIKPLLERVLRAAIHRLPENLQGIAMQVAKHFGLAEISGETDEATAGPDEIQREFHERCARILFAPSPQERDLEMAQIASESTSVPGDTLYNLDQARARLADRLSRLSEGEDAGPAFEEFLPALLPALQLGIRLIGRSRVVSFLAKLLGKLLERFVGPQYTPALSKAIVDAGLKLISLEATPEDANRAAHAAVISTVEDAVRRVSELPEYVLDNPEMLEGAALEAVEQAAAANFPPVLRAETYRARPELRESSHLGGTWIAFPICGPVRYKKFSRVLRTRVSPDKARATETFGGETLGEFLEEQMEQPPGDDLVGEVHLYESMPGTTLPELSRLEAGVPGLGTSDEASYGRIHPLTRHAAGVLLGEPGLGRHFSAHAMESRRHIQPGHRFYHVAVHGLHPAPSSVGPRKLRRHSSVKIAFDFNASEIRTRLYLGENYAQRLLLKLRQQGQDSAILAALRTLLDKKLEAALLPRAHGSVRIIHPAVVARLSTGAALKRLPAELSSKLRFHLLKWMLHALEEVFKTRAKEVESAIEAREDGISFVIAFQAPPGMDLLKNAFAIHPGSSGATGFPEGDPKYTVKIVSGHAHV
jgi:hypothetical protein